MSLFICRNIFYNSSLINKKVLKKNIKHRLKFIKSLLKGEELMRVVCIAAGCVGLLTTFGMMPSFAAEVSNPFIQQEAARADASLRQRVEAPMTGAALSQMCIRDSAYIACFRRN